MEFAGVPDERHARSAAARRPNTPRDLRRPSTGTGRPEPVRPNNVTPKSAGFGDADVSATADHRQADYFLRLLAQRRRLVDHRIGEYQKAITTSRAKGNVDAACSYGRMMRVEEQDRRTLDGMIDQLRRRFPGRGLGDIPSIAARPRAVAH